MTNDNDFTQGCQGILCFALDTEGEVSTCRCTRLVDCRSSSHGAVVTCTLCVVIHGGTVADAQGEYSGLLGAWKYTYVTRQPVTIIYRLYIMCYYIICICMYVSVKKYFFIY